MSEYNWITGSNHDHLPCNPGDIAYLIKIRHIIYERLCSSSERPWLFFIALLQSAGVFYSGLGKNKADSAGRYRFLRIICDFCHAFCEIETCNTFTRIT